MNDGSAGENHEDRVELSAAQPQDEGGVRLAEEFAEDADDAVADQEFAAELPGRCAVCARSAIAHSRTVERPPELRQRRAAMGAAVP